MEKNAQSTKPNYASTCRANIFFMARPMHQGGRNGATNPLFRARKDTLTSVVSKVRNFSNTKFGGHLEKNAQSTKPNYASTCRAIILFLGSANAPRRAQRSHQSTLFVRERARLLVLFPRSVTFQTTNLGEFGENCPICKSELRINVTREYLFYGLCHERGKLRCRSGKVIYQ